MSNSERRKNYRWGITPGEWMQAAGVIGIMLIASLTFYVRAEAAFDQVDKNQSSLNKMKHQQKADMKQLRDELKDEIKESEQRTRADIRELRTIMLQRAQ